MEPDTNPTSNNAPTPAPAEPVVAGPTTPAEPVAAAPINPAVSAAPAVPTVPAEPVIPVAPAEAVTPAEPVAPVAPAEAVTPAEPVAPVAPAEAVAPAEPVVPVSPTEPTVPATPPFSSVNDGSIGATEPITRPEPTPTMSSEEKELAAPIMAANPVPGSIGSAVSMPGGAQPQSVTFNDPATEVAAAQNMPMNTTAMPNMARPKADKIMLFGKEVDKKFLIIAGSLAGILIIVLIIILIMQLSS